MLINYKTIFFFIYLISNILADIDVKNLNENSQLKIPLKKNIYLSSSIYINDKEYEIPIDMGLDRTWINLKDKPKNHDKELVINECALYEMKFKSKNNIPISFFDKDLILEEISFNELESSLDQLNCDTKNGIISLSPRSEKKVLNLLTQLNKEYLLKKYFSIYNYELILGNFDEEIKNSKYIVSHVLHFENKWTIPIHGIYFGETDSSKKNNNNEFIINVLNNNYKKILLNVEFNCIQRLIIVEYYYLQSININIFKNKCEIRGNEKEKFEGIYCDKNVINELPDLSFMINDKLLHVPINKLFIKDKNYPNEFLFLIAYSDIIWEKGPCVIGNYFFNELGIKVIFDAENTYIYILSNDIIENVKIVNDYAVDNKQKILNNNSFSLYDFILCCILISNFLGIIILVASLYKEKFLGKMAKSIKKIKRMNKE